jgi:hypothetical protein
LFFLHYRTGIAIHTFLYSCNEPKSLSNFLQIDRVYFRIRAVLGCNVKLSARMQYVCLLLNTSVNNLFVSCSYTNFTTHFYHNNSVLHGSENWNEHKGNSRRQIHK